MSVISLVLALLLLSVSCSQAEDSASEPRSGSPTTASTLAAPGVDAPVPVAGCDGIGPVPDGGEMTWVANGRLFAATPGGRSRCLLGVPEGGQPVWGAKGDRVLVAPAGARVGEETVRLSLGEGVPSWSRPTGTSVLVLEDGGLRKVALAGGAGQDVSFLFRHQEAVYHPGGRFIYSVGEDEPGNYGIFLATNQGKERRAVAQSESARRIHGLAFSLDTLFFVAEHPFERAGNRNHLHWRTQDPEPPLFTLPLPDGHVDKLIVSPVDAGKVAVQMGECPAGRSVLAGDPTTDPADEFNRSHSRLPAVDVGAADTEVVGWLPGGRLVVLGRPGCGQPGILWVVPQDSGGAPSPERIADGVEAAAVRELIPDGAAVPVEAQGLGTPVIA